MVASRCESPSRISSRIAKVFRKFGRYMTRVGHARDISFCLKFRSGLFLITNFFRYLTLFDNRRKQRAAMSTYRVSSACFTESANSKEKFSGFKENLFPLITPSLPSFRHRARILKAWSANHFRHGRAGKHGSRSGWELRLVGFVAVVVVYARRRRSRSGTRPCGLLLLALRSVCRP